MTKREIWATGLAAVAIAYGLAIAAAYPHPFLQIWQVVWSVWWA
jgi:hypothetical protein